MRIFEKSQITPSDKTEFQQIDLSFIRTRTTDLPKGNVDRVRTHSCGSVPHVGIFSDRVCLDLESHKNVLIGLISQILEAFTTTLYNYVLSLNID